jgi:hypothetical protein
LIFTASEVETATLAAGINPAFAGLLGGMSGGIAQAYATMGGCSVFDELVQYTASLCVTIMHESHLHPHE